MGRGLAGRPIACDVHPHRAAADRCDACLGHFCAECFIRDGERLLCRTCHEMAPVRAAEAARRQRWSYWLAAALRERRASLAAGAVILGFLGGGAALAVWGARTGTAGGSSIAQALADEPAVLLRATAARYCSGGSGSGVTGEVPGNRGGTGGATGSPTFKAPTGALLAAVAGVLPDTLLKDDRVAGTPAGFGPYDPMNLVPYRSNPPPGWRSQTALFPQQVGFELRGEIGIDRVAFLHSAATPRDTWAKEVALSLSTDGPDDGFYSVGRWTLAQTTAPQEFVFFGTAARYVRVCFYANYGSNEAVSLTTLALGAATADLQVGSSPLLSPAR